MDLNNYLYLSENEYLKFDPVSQITNVFYDECRQQIFIVKACTTVVKSTHSESFSFCMENGNPLISIKFSRDNNILAVQRNENSLELIGFKNNQILVNSSIYYETKKTLIYGFIWSDNNELVTVTGDSVDIFQVDEVTQVDSGGEQLVLVQSHQFCAFVEQQWAPAHADLHQVRQSHEGGADTAE
jgi:regulator of MON1-CCZ1 complex